MPRILVDDFDAPSCTGAPTYTNNGVNVGGTQPWFEWISKVEIGGIANTSQKEGYRFFDNPGAIELTEGNQVNLKLEPGLSWAGQVSDIHWNVFIDYNRDGDFDDANENVIQMSGNRLSADEMITIPAGISAGCTRLRVTMQRDQYAGSAERFDFGEVEDYLVTLKAGNGGGNTGGGGPTPSSITLQPGVNVTAAAAAGASTVIVSYATPTATTTCAQGGLSILRTSGPVSGAQFPVGVTTVQFRATDLCGNVQTTSLTVTVNATPPTGGGGGAVSCTGSTPTYSCNGVNIGGWEPWWEWIARVKFAGIDNASSKESYKFFNQAGPAAVSPGSSATLEVTPGLSWAQYQTNLYYSAYIDWNRDGDFDDLGEEVLRQNTVSQAVSVPVYVPANAVPGLTRMRIMVQRDAYAGVCENFSFGEMEDYVVCIGGGNSSNGILTLNTPTNQAFNIAPGQTTATVVYPMATASTTCPDGGATVTRTSGPASGSDLAAGVYTVVFTATDACGNTQTKSSIFTVLAANNGTLTLSTPANQSVTIASGQTTATVVYPMATASTTCPAGGATVTRTSGPASGSTLAAGTYTVVFSATDACGNTTTGTTQLTVNPAGGNTNPPVYTTPVGGTQPWFEWITRVQFATIDNPSNKEGFKFFDQVAPASVGRGSAQTLTVTPGLSWAQYQTNLYYTAYIDYNRDGDFDDLGEEILRDNTLSAGVTGSVTIPANASLGATRLRIVMKRDSYATSAEERFDFGETEDYLINIVGGQVNPTVLTLTAPAPLTFSVANGQTTAAVVYPNATATTTCPAGGISIDRTSGPVSGSDLTAGVYTVVFTATDACGNTETASTEITVTPPNNGTLSLNGPADQTINIAPGQTTATVVYPDAIATTTCPLGGVNVVQASGPASGSELTAGTYSVVFTATDACGNTQNATSVITVVAPINGSIVLSGPNNQTLNIAPGSTTATVIFPDAIGLTTCPLQGLVVSQVSGPTSGSVLTAGVYSVVYSAIDACGNTAMTTTVITVIAPNNGAISFAGPADQELNIQPGQTTATLIYPAPVGSTTCPIGGLNVVLVSGPASGEALAAGSYTIVYTATDACGNTVTSTTTITVVAPDNGILAFDPKDDLIIDIPAGQNQVVVNYDEPTATTTCPIGGLVVSRVSGPANGDELTAGVYTVEYSATDACGNSATLSITITVIAPDPCALGFAVECEANVNNGVWTVLGDCSVTVNQGDKLILSVNPNNAASYQWVGPNGFTATGSWGGDALVSSAITPAEAGEYTVTITDTNGCTEQATITVVVIACASGDSDGDGICDNDDCQPHNPAIPAAPGTPCNDGNSLTQNDKILADGCSCGGELVGPVCTFKQVNFKDWENNAYGFWNDGGSNCTLSGAFAANGSARSVELRGDGLNISSTFTDVLDLSSISKVEIDFMVLFNGMEVGDNLVLEYSTDGGGTYQIAHDWFTEVDLFNSTVFTNIVVEIEATFSTHTKFRFRSRGNGSLTDKIYLDNIKFSKCEGSNDPYAGQRPTYRTFDGKLNNLDNPAYGTTGRPLFRALPPQYGDGIGSLAGPNRPSPRHISNQLSDEPQDRRDERLLSGMAYQFGQFLDHDITRTEGGDRAVAPIQIPSYDPIFTTNTVIPFTRSKAIEGSSPRQQANLITAYIDASNVYGSDEAVAKWLRTFQDGKLKTSKGNLLPYNTIDGEFDSPGDPNAPRMDRDRNRDGSINIVAVAGDFRANEHPNLTSLHTVFVREHNRICDLLKAQGESDDEIIYQKARKLVGGIMQKIVYEEFIPAFGVSLSPYTGYKSNVVPDIRAIFSTAAFRWHTMVENDIILRNDACEGIANVELPLKTIFFNPAIVRQYGPGVLLRGLVFHPQYRTDLKVNNGLRNFLFGQGSGFDLVSINLQRGRDHGLPDYNTVRSHYGFGKVSSFDQINSDYNINSRLQKVYGDVNDVDLWAGMFAEPLEPGTSLPRTAIAIVKEQFEALRDGDFYYYKNDPFLTSAELNFINSSSLSEILKRNTSTRDIPSNVFFKPPCSNDDPLEDLNDMGRVVCTDPGATFLTSCNSTTGISKNVGIYTTHTDVRKINVNLGYSVRITNTQGESTYYTDDTGCLPAAFSGSNIASIQVICLSNDPSTIDCSGFAGALFNDCFSSPMPITTPGLFNMEQLKSLSVANDEVSAIRVNNGFKVILYADDDFQGVSQEFVGPTVTCLSTALNNKVSSMEVVCLSDPNRSNCGFDAVAGAIFEYGDSHSNPDELHIGVSVGPGDYDMARLLAIGAKNDGIGSVKVNNGYAITLFEHDNFEGNYTVYLGDESDLTTTITETSYPIWDILGLFPYTNTVTMNNKASSMKVRCIEGLQVSPRTGSEITFEAVKDQSRSKLTIDHNFGKDALDLMVEKYNGASGIFELLELLPVDARLGSHTCFDKYPHQGDNIYRVIVQYADGSTAQTEHKVVHFDLALQSPPVVLHAQPSNEGVELSWITTVLPGDEMFVLERKTKNSDWTVIDEFIAPEPSFDAVSTRYIDEQPEVGTNEYRVRLTSSIEERNSNLQEVDYLNANAVVLFPNPTSTEVNISLKGFAGHAVDITVANRLGQIIETMHIDEATELPVRMSTEKMQDGVHMVQVKAGGAAKTIPLVIIKE